MNGVKHKSKEYGCYKTFVYSVYIYLYTHTHCLIAIFSMKINMICKHTKKNIYMGSFIIFIYVYMNKITPYDI